MIAHHRCPWCGSDPLYIAYHDKEWGVPQRDSRALFETLILAGFQAGLSWYTILKKRSQFRVAFEGFAPEQLARYRECDVARLLTNAGIVRHRGKIEAAIVGAQSWLEMEGDEGFDKFVWKFVDDRPLQNEQVWMADVPAESTLSREISKALRSRGFRFCGPTIVYAFMQAAGLVNDHLIGCPRHEQIAAMAKEPA